MKFIFLILLLAINMTYCYGGEAQLLNADIQKVVNDSMKSKWYEKIQIKGYVHFRYNRLMETNDKLVCPGCDRSLGDKQGFFFRRARLTFFGDVSDKVSIYIQPDYSADANAGTPSGPQQNFLQLRDAYFDYHFDESREYRLRTGLSKVPYGFDNLQSSSIRAAFDRDDALNSAIPNERDMGLFFMWAPHEIRKRFKDLANYQLKGSGDFGVFAIGTYNGQSMNRPEKNNDLHRVIRMTYPWKLSSGQFVEASIQAYEGKYNSSDNNDYRDQRSAASLIYYPQPFGFQAEYTEGSGPEYDAKKDKITNQRAKGGYVQISYQILGKTDRYYPFIRFQEYNGARKLENNSPSNRLSEWEIGSEWQPNQALELTASYMISNRYTQSSSTNKLHTKGNVLRLQAQFNY
jgi:phosphate-selective porin